MRRELSADEAVIADRLMKLKDEAGSHSPSFLTLREQIPELEIAVDACFISNPYATQLFLDYLQRELIDTGAIRDVLGSYPSQNQVIAALLAAHLGLGPEWLFVGNGAIEIIQAVIHNFAKRRVLVNLPTFSSYYEFAEGRVDVVFHALRKEDDFRLDPDEYLAKVAETHPDLVVLINPNNPDGSYLPCEDLSRIVAGLPPDVTCVVDESFIHFAFEDMNLDIRSVIGECGHRPNLVVVKSMSKDFGIAGIRAGYAVMHPERVGSLLRNGFLWNSRRLRRPVRHRPQAVHPRDAALLPATGEGATGAGLPVDGQLRAGRDPRRARRGRADATPLDPPRRLRPDLQRQDGPRRPVPAHRLARAARQPTHHRRTRRRPRRVRVWV